MQKCLQGTWNEQQPLRSRARSLHPSRKSCSTGFCTLLLPAAPERVPFSQRGRPGTAAPGGTGPVDGGGQVEPAFLTARSSQALHLPLTTHLRPSLRRSPGLPCHPPHLSVEPHTPSLSSKCSLLLEGPSGWPLRLQRLPVTWDPPPPRLGSTPAEL